MSIVFENVWVLLTVAGVALVIVYGIRQAKPEWGYWPLLIPLAIVGAAFGLDAMVQTNTEAINEIISSSKQAAINGDVKTLMAFVSPDYSDSSHRSKSALENEVEGVLNGLSIKKVKTQSHLLTLNENTARSELNVVVHLGEGNRYAEMGSLMFIGVELDYEKLGEKWYISSADIVSVNDQPWNW
jgi:hypothetical protein